MGEAKQVAAWEWHGDYLFEGDQIVLAPEHDGSITWTDEERVKRLIESAPLMLAAIQAAADLLRRCDGERCQPTDKPATNENWDRVVELLKLAEVAATNKVLPLADVVAKGGA